MVAFGKRWPFPVLADIGPESISQGNGVVQWKNVPAIILNGKSEGWWCALISGTDWHALKLLGGMLEEHHISYGPPDTQIADFPFDPFPRLVFIRKDVLSDEALRRTLKSVGIATPVGVLELCPFFIVTSQWPFYQELVKWIQNIFIRTGNEYRLPAIYK